MRTPVVLVTGVDETPMAAATVSLQWDLPNVAVVRHDLDLRRGTLTRVVSDVTGEFDRAQIDLEHACVTCAIREDVVPTLLRLARIGRWTTLIAHLPLGAPADQVCSVLARDPHYARRLRVGAVITALSDSVTTDLLGDAVLGGRGEVYGDDGRGVGETLCDMVEFADIIIAPGGGMAGDAADGIGAALLQTLARPGAEIVRDAALLDTASTVPGAGLLARHSHGRTMAWCDPFRVPEPRSENGVWQVLLTSPHPLQPDRLLDDLESLATGPYRSRGIFWLPTRPGDAIEWEGAGGQLTIGNHAPWGQRTPHTRLLFTGVGHPPGHLRGVFDSMLESAPHSRLSARIVEDGFEPWLGSLSETA